MKKILFLFMFAGMIFSTTSCKKKENSCSDSNEPELHGAGTWKASKIIYQQNDVTNSGDPKYNCWLGDKIILNKEQTGTSWHWTDYDSNNGTCDATDYDIVSWAESWPKKRLYLTIGADGNNYDFSFDFVNENQIKIQWGSAPGALDIYYDKQGE